MMPSGLSDLFPQYTQFKNRVPVWCVTPRAGGTIHRFYDTSPFSPSGRFLGLTRLPFEDRLPSPGDVAEIVVVDLATGTERVVAASRAWDTQLGAQVQWGQTDAELLYNDLDTRVWQPFGVVLDQFSGSSRTLGGPVYMVSPSGRWAASPCLQRMGLTQAGYGVIVPPSKVSFNHGAPADDGVYVTNIRSGECRLLVSLKTIVDAAIPLAAREQFRGGSFYCFHVKWNAREDRIMVVLRWAPGWRRGRMRSMLVTMRADGTHIHNVLPAEAWDRGGHHPNWCPDGDSLIMNLAVETEDRPSIGLHWLRAIRSAVLGDSRSEGVLRLVRVQHNGGYQVLAPCMLGSGHPTMHPNGQQIITDAYRYEPVAFGDGTVPIRLINIAKATEETLIRISAKPAYEGPRGELRIDPHPAWDRNFRYLAFNGNADRTRRVFVADLASVLA